MEDVVEGLGRLIVRFIKWMIIEAIIETVLYWCGRIVLKVFTFGNYPRKEDDAEAPCVITGIIAIIAAVAAVVMFYQ